MADLSVTAASVIPGDGHSEVGVLGDAAMTAGETVYLDESDGTWKGAFSAGTAAQAGVGSKVGILLTGGGAGQPCVVRTRGKVTLGAILTAGSAYYVGAAAGGIAPVADLGAGDFVTLLGIASTTSMLDLQPVIAGVEL